MWNLKNKINKQTKQRHTHRYKEQTDGCHMEGSWGAELKKVKKLRNTNWSWGSKVQHREYSQ